MSASDLSKFEEELDVLCKRFHGGIVLRGLADVYQMHFGRKLPYAEMGFSCVEQLIVHIHDRLELHDGMFCCTYSYYSVVVAYS